MSPRVPMCAAVLSAAIVLSGCAAEPSIVRTAAITARDQFVLTIRTGNVEDAGTDANIYIRLYGYGAYSGPILLDSPEDDFERGKIQRFTVTATKLNWDYDALLGVMVWHDNSGRRPGWYLDYIKVKNLRTGLESKLTFRRWLAKDEAPDHATAYYKDIDGYGSAKAPGPPPHPQPNPAPAVTRQRPPTTTNQCPGTNVARAMRLDPVPSAGSGPRQYSGSLLLVGHTGTITTIANTSTQTIQLLDSGGGYHRLGPGQVITARQVWGFDPNAATTIVAAVEGTVGPDALSVTVYLNCA